MSTITPKGRVPERSNSVQSVKATNLKGEERGAVHGPSPRTLVSLRALSYFIAPGNVRDLYLRMLSTLTRT